MRAKLSSLGVYIPQAKVTKTGKTIVRKDELVGQIEARFGLELPSLVKATKADLEALSSAIMLAGTEAAVAEAKVADEAVDETVDEGDSGWNVDSVKNVLAECAAEAE